MSFGIDIKGLKELQAKIAKLPDDLKARVNGQIERGAQVFVSGAKRDAPKDFAGGIGLAGGISYATDKTRLAADISSAVFYSPYLEWGTIEHVSVPVELQAYAIQFKGKGIRKTGGIIPHPFFFKQLPLAKQTIETGIVAELKDVKL